MNKDYHISNLMRLVGYCLGAIDGIIMSLEDEKLKSKLINIHYEVSTSLDEIIIKYGEDLDGNNN
jgi:hypothetical protein